MTKKIHRKCKILLKETPLLILSVFLICDTPINKQETRYYAHGVSRDLLFH